MTDDPRDYEPDQELPGVEYAVDWLTKNGHETAARALGRGWYGIEYDGDEPPNDSALFGTVDLPALEVLARAYDPQAFEDHPIEQRRKIAALQWGARRTLAIDAASKAISLVGPMIAKAVTAEREACARRVETWPGVLGPSREGLAAAIRERVSR